MNLWGDLMSFFFFYWNYNVFQNCVRWTQMSSDSETQTVVPVPMPCDYSPVPSTTLPCCLFDVSHPPSFFSSPKEMAMVKGMFSAGHLGTHYSHCPPDFSIPCSLFSQIPPNYLSDFWLSGGLLEFVPSPQSLRISENVLTRLNVWNTHKSWSILSWYLSTTWLIYPREITGICSIYQSLMASVVNYFTVIQSILSYLSLIHLF